MTQNYIDHILNINSTPDPVNSIFNHTVSTSYTDNNYSHGGSLDNNESKNCTEYKGCQNPSYSSLALEESEIKKNNRQNNPNDTIKSQSASAFRTEVSFTPNSKESDDDDRANGHDSLNSTSDHSTTRSSKKEETPSLSREINDNNDKYENHRAIKIEEENKEEYSNLHIRLTINQLLSSCDCPDHRHHNHNSQREQEIIREDNTRTQLGQSSRHIQEEIKLNSKLQVHHHHYLHTKQNWNYHLKTEEGGPILVPTRSKYKSSLIVNLNSNTNNTTLTSPYLSAQSSKDYDTDEFELPGQARNSEPFEESRTSNIDHLTNSLERVSLPDKLDSDNIERLSESGSVGCFQHRESLANTVTMNPTGCSFIGSIFRNRSSSSTPNLEEQSSTSSAEPVVSRNGGDERRDSNISDVSFCVESDFSSSSAEQTAPTDQLVADPNRDSGLLVANDQQTQMLNGTGGLVNGRPSQTSLTTNSSNYLGHSSNQLTVNCDPMEQQNCMKPISSSTYACPMIAPYIAHAKLRGQRPINSHSHSITDEPNQLAIIETIKIQQRLSVDNLEQIVSNMRARVAQMNTKLDESERRRFGPTSRSLVEKLIASRKENFSLSVDCQLLAIELELYRKDVLLGATDTAWLRQCSKGKLGSIIRPGEENTAQILDAIPASPHYQLNRYHEELRRQSLHGMTSSTSTSSTARSGLSQGDSGGGTPVSPKIQRQHSYRPMPPLPFNPILSGNYFLHQHSANLIQPTPVLPYPPMGDRESLQQPTRPNHFIGGLNPPSSTTETSGYPDDCPTWSCPRCTFANNGFLNECEICKWPEKTELEHGGTGQTSDKGVPR